MPKKETIGKPLSPKAQLIADILGTEPSGTVVPRFRFVQGLMTNHHRLFPYGGGASIGLIRPLINVYCQETGSEVEAVRGEGYRVIVKRQVKK